MVTTGLVAIDATVLAAAVTSVVDDLGGATQFPWLFSIYLLTQAVSTPLFAKLADQRGRKPVILLGIAVFLVGSVLCGFAWNMPALIAFRAVQGLGAGAIQPMAVTIVGDIYSVAERAKVQAYISSVWAVSAVLGPALGGLFSQFSMWRAVFFINVPLCLLAAALLIRRFDEQVHRVRHTIDVRGALLLAGATSAFILALLEGGQAWAWLSWQSVTAFVVAAVLVVMLVRVERRAVEPVLPLALLGRRLLATTTVLASAVGAVLLGLTTYVPSYLEHALDIPPLAAGLALAALMIGWPVSSVFSGSLFYLRIGFTRTTIIGFSVVVAATVVLALFARTPTLWLVVVACFVVGMGLGLGAVPALIAAQASVAWVERGVVTGASMFARSLGSAVGVAVFGAVANIHGTGTGPPATDAVERTAAVLLAIAVTAAIGLALACAMPKTPAPGREQPPA